MTLASLKDTIDRFGLRATKALGQHFLLDMNITGKAARCGGDLSTGTVIEIGPGPGGLTRAILECGAANVVAIEMDRRCVAALTELQAAYPGKLTVIEGDAMKISLPEITQGPRKIIANLPYNVGTLLLMQWLEDIARADSEAPPYLSMTLMFQREVAERIAAAPDTKEYGRVSVMAQWLCEVLHEFELPPGAFSPPPKVYSSVITLTPRATRLGNTHWDAMHAVLAAGFGNRRKMLRQSLKTSGANAEQLLANAGIDGTRRAETLSVAEWCVLAEAYSVISTR